MGAQPQPETVATGEYNYRSFARSESVGRSNEFKTSLRAGDAAPDFELPTPEGDLVRLSGFRGQRHILLEFGSITWPPFVGEVSPLNQLYIEFRDKGFEFLTVYVREPHPGERYHEHRSWQDKLGFAVDCRAQDGIATPLLVDDLAGTVHRLYGMLPNMVYIVDKQGRIAYKAMWTDHDEIRTVLANLVLADELTAQGLRLKPSYTERISYIPAEYAGGVRDKVFDRAGPQAWTDYKRTFGA